MSRTLAPDIMRALRAVDTPTICNAIEEVIGRRRDDGFTRGDLICHDTGLPPMVGFARTARLVTDQPSADPPQAIRKRRMGYYAYVAEGGAPRIVVIQDAGRVRGLGAFWGEVNAAIHKGLGIQGVLTDGSIRDRDAIERGFQLLAGSHSPSHAFATIADFGEPVTVFGLAIAHDDLVHADRHGAVVIEPGVEKELPRAIDMVIRKEAPILRAARAPGFDIDKLVAAWGEADDVH